VSTVVVDTAKAVDARTCIERELLYRVRRDPKFGKFVRETYGKEQYRADQDQKYPHDYPGLSSS
jgi:hypothetical protein